MSATSIRIVSNINTAQPPSPPPPPIYWNIKPELNTIYASAEESFLLLAAMIITYKIIGFKHLTIVRFIVGLFCIATAISDKAAINEMK